MFRNESNKKTIHSERPSVHWVYNRLFTCFGTQGWWPVTPKGKQKPVYSPRYTQECLTRSQKFEVAVGAILTQNTTWKNAETAIFHLHEADRMAPEKILKTPVARLQRLIRSSGYFRQKADRLKIFSRFLAREWNGRIDVFLNRSPMLVRKELLSLKGIGPETADCILLYAGGHPQFVVDAYTRRIASRLQWTRQTDYQTVQNYFTRQMAPSVPAYREYHALLVELAKQFCRAKNPVCVKCPLQSRCAIGMKRKHLKKREN